MSGQDAVFTDLDLAGLDALTDSSIEVLEDRFRQVWANGDYVEYRRNGDTLHIDYLLSTGGKHRIVELASIFPGYFRERGIAAVTASADPAMEKTLRGIGMSEEHGLFRGGFESGCRLDQYAAWKRGETEEPSWRTSPAGHPVGK